MEKRILDKVHSSVLKIMDEIVRLCDEHQIEYFLLGGTLLGAVRHKGFIPWDDDLDIGMCRKDYLKFIEICKKLKEHLEDGYVIDMPFPSGENNYQILKTMDYLSNYMIN